MLIPIGRWTGTDVEADAEVGELEVPTGAVGLSTGLSRGGLLSGSASMSTSTSSVGECVVYTGEVGEVDPVVGDVAAPWGPEDGAWSESGGPAVA